MRLTRLRFILLRTFWISLFITIILQLVTYFNEHSSEQIVSTISDENAFWKTIFNQDQHLTDQQRIEFIRNQIEHNEKNVYNWTGVFLDNYARKLVTLNERDSKTTLKERRHTSQQMITQTTIDIFEDTTVRVRKCRLFYCV